MKTTNPTDIEGVEEYKETYWVPSIGEYRDLSVWREANGSYGYTFEIGSEHTQTGFPTGRAAYDAGVAALMGVAPDAAVNTKPYLTVKRTKSEIAVIAEHGDLATANEDRYTRNTKKTDDSSVYETWTREEWHAR